MKPWERYASPSVEDTSQSDPYFPAMADGPPATGEQPDPPRRMSAAEQDLRNLVRPIGKAARMAVQGAVGLPAMFANAAAGASNFAFGTHIPDQHQNVSRLLTNLGLPEYEGAVERVLGGIGEAITGTGVAVKGARLVEKGARAAGASLTSAMKAQQGGQSLAAHLAQGPNPLGANYVTQALQAAPATQAQAAAGAAAGSGIAREMDAHPAVQLLTGVAGSVVTPLAAQLPGAVWRGTKALLQPLSQSGQEKIVGGRLNVAALNRNEAITNMRTAEEIVPGSFPTTGEASRDLGLIGLQKTVTERSKGMGEGMPFGARAQAQNTARLNALDDVTGSPEALSSMARARSALGKGMRDEALSRASRPVPTDSVMQKIDSILKSPEGARGSVKKAMEMARNAIGDETDPKRLYEVGKDINESILKQLQKEDPSAYLARGSLSEVRKELYSSINKVAPGFEDYIDTYAKVSKPINRMEEAQALTARTELAPTDMQGERILSQSKWASRVKYALPDLKKSGALSDEQIGRLQKIGEDLDRGALLNNPFAKSSGSDTVRNLTGANLVGAIAGGNVNLGPVSGTLMGPLNFLYKIPNQQMERLLQEAMLDPGLAARLMANVTPKANASLGAALRRKATAIGIAIPYGSDRDKRNRSN